VVATSSAAYERRRQYPEVNAPLPLQRSRCFARIIFDGGGLRRWAAALRLTPQAIEKHRLF